MSDPHGKSSVDGSRFGEEVAHDAARAGEEARRTGERYAEELQGTAAERIEHIAGGLEAAADRLRGDEDMVARQVSGAARALADFAGRLQGQSFMETVREVEDFGRRHRARFRGLAGAVGLGLGRAAKARPPDHGPGAQAPAPYPPGQTTAAAGTPAASPLGEGGTTTPQSPGGLR